MIPEHGVLLKKTKHCQSQVPTRPQPGLKWIKMSTNNLSITQQVAFSMYRFNSYWGICLCLCLYVKCLCVCVVCVCRTGASGPAGQVLASSLFTRHTPSLFSLVNAWDWHLQRNALVIYTINISLERKYSFQYFICWILLKVLIVRGS